MSTKINEEKRKKILELFFGDKYYIAKDNNGNS
jgi:hypothetical protein